MRGRSARRRASWVVGHVATGSGMLADLDLFHCRTPNSGVSSILHPRFFTFGLKGDIELHNIADMQRYDYRPAPPPVTTCTAVSTVAHVA